MAALVLLARAVALLPWSWLRRLGAVVGAWAGSFLRIRRRHVESSMRMAGIADPPARARAMYASLGTSLLEFLWVAGRAAPPRSRVGLTPRAAAVLQRHRDRMIVATAHTGNWDLVACAAAREHVALTIVTKRLAVRWLDEFWQRVRAAQNIELLSGDALFSRAAGALARGRAVALLIDQAPERSSAVIEASFMGQRARCDLMPALLAARTRAPLVLALGRRLADGSHEIDIPLVLEPPQTPSRDWIETTTRELTSALEDFVRIHPAQWLWLHRRWKGFPERACQGAVRTLSLSS
ncbi:MAG TPA: lysophospholipid acyltransferase family protein [Polyangiaceae bacterium]